MSNLEELIQHWKDRLASAPEQTPGRDKEAIRSTIRYLEKLNAFWKE